MAQPLRDKVPNASYNDASRGKKRHAAFKRGAAKLPCLSYGQISTNCYYTASHAYPLTANHHRLLIREPSGSLPQITRHINCACATYLHPKRDRFPGTYPRGAIKPSWLQGMPTA